MSTTYHDETGQQWTVDEIAPGGEGSISDAGLVGERALPAFTTLVFRRVQGGSLRIATDVSGAWRDDRSVMTRAFTGSVALSLPKP